MVPGFPQLAPPVRTPAVRRPWEPTRPTPPTSSRIAVRHEYPPDRLGVRIDVSNGYSNRWAEDEHLAQNVLSNIEFEDEMPGGDKMLSGTLARDPQFQWPDIDPYADIAVYNPYFDNVWEGFLDKGPDVSGDQMSITPAALGYQSILEDNKAQSIGIINAELSAWEGASAQRRINLLNANRPIQQDGQVADGVAYTSLRMMVENGWVEPIIPISESWFDAGAGCAVKWIQFDWQNGNANTAFEARVYACDDDAAGINLETFGGDWYTAVSGHFSWAGAVGHRHALLNWEYTATPAGVEGWQFMVDITNLKVIGDTDIWANVKGIWPNIGFTAKQILEYAVPTAAAPLEARPGDIEDDEYIIEHAWYDEKGPTADIVHDVTKYALWDWYIRYGKRFHYKQPGTYGNYWKAYVRESQLNEVGIDSQSLWDEIVVRFQDVSGRTLYVGPPGSGCDVESEALKITDPDHPAVRAGRKRRDILDMKGISNPAQAIEVGLRFLEESVLLNHAGSATLTGYVLDHNGVFWPAACVRSGDFVSFLDAADPSYRKIVNRKYNHNNRGAEIDLDAPPSGMEALLERLQASLITLGVV